MFTPHPPRRASSLAAPLLALLLMTLGACGASETTRTEQAAIASELTVSPEMASIDERLSGLEARTDDTRTRVSHVQEIIGARIVPDEFETMQMEMAAGRLFLEMNEKNILRLNGVVMSDDSFLSYVNSRGSHVCQPAPVFVIHPDADYDAVTRSLEVFYGQGCPNIDIIERDPAQIADPTP